MDGLDLSIAQKCPFKKLVPKDFLRVTGHLQFARPCMLIWERLVDGVACIYSLVCLSEINN